MFERVETTKVNGPTVVRCQFVIEKEGAVGDTFKLAFSAFFFVDTNYTHVDRTALLEQRVALKELQDLLRRVKEDYFYYRKLVREYPRDEQVQKRLRELEKEIERVEEEIKSLKRGVR